MPKRYKTPAPLPEPYDRELLVILVEECTETMRELMDVQMRASKLLRFGADEIQPKQDLTNAQRLGQEIGDLFAMVDHLVMRGVVHRADIIAGRERKERQLDQFMQEDR